MTCDIKNEKCPFQIQCLFPTAANDRQTFALYFHTSQGIQERVLFCAYNGHYRCFDDQGFKETHNGFNNVTITVPDTFAPREGFFNCQKGDISMVKTCSYPPPEICNNNISSTNSTIGLETTTKGINSSLTTEQFGNKGNSTPIDVVPIVVPIVIVLIFIFGLLLFMKWRSKSRERSKTHTIYNGVPSVITNGERKKSSLVKENTGNHVEQSLINLAPDSLMEVIMGWNKPINRDNVLTVNEQTANVDQRHPSTSNRTSGASSKIQPTLSTSVSTSSLKSNGSNKPLLPH